MLKVNGADTQQFYERVNIAYRKAGLMGRKVLATPGYEAAVEAVRQHAENFCGWTGLPMGPVSRDTWDSWLHIFSHTLCREHHLAHAKLELELAELVIDRLRVADDTRRSPFKRGERLGG